MDQSTYEKLRQQPDVSALGAAFMRDEVLPTILGTDQMNILYWIGRQVARQNPLADEVAIMNFFDQVGFGTLTRIKQNRRQQQFTLTGTTVMNRLAANPTADFDLEAGFLAQQFELITGAATEGTVNEIHRDGVSLMIQSDPNDLVGDLAANVPTLSIKPKSTPPTDGDHI